MNIQARLVLFSMSLLAWTGVFAAEEQPVETKRKLRFVKSSRTIGIGAKNLEITHRAQLFLKQDRKFAHPAAVAGGILDLPAASSLSEEQRNSLAATASGVTRYWGIQYTITHDTPLGMHNIQLHAVSEQDARKMAELFLAYLDLSAASEFKRLEEAVKHYREEAPRLEKKITELESEHKGVSLKVEKLRNTLYYQGLEDAQASIADFRRILRSVDIDIIGIGAKIDAIKKARSKQNRTRESHATLDRLTVIQDIDMAGALGRKRAAEAELDKAKEFHDLLTKQIRLAKEQNKLKDELATIQQRLPQREKELANPPIRMRPVTVLDNKVTIHPVRVDREE